ncbi:MAG TPA: DUF4336 domain-containing protein [Rhodanobacteraceae bacterium]|nr:DUF4336 domain-containing protein [Rhodanobacteraceae bacterium]
MADTGLYEPINILKPVAADVWIVDGPVVRMATPIGGFPVTTRMTVVRLRDATIWCHSPTAPDAGLFAAIDALGPVRQLVSPNMLHYAFIAAWKRRYPEATAWASPGVRKRAASQHIEVAFDADLADTPPQVWVTDIDQLRFRGSRVLEEFVFFHRASATLVLADLIENFEREKLTRGMRWLARLGGVLDPDGKIPLDFRLTMTGRKRLARACFEKIMAWRPQRVILAHGRCFERNAEAELRRAFRWLD